MIKSFEIQKGRIITVFVLHIYTLSILAFL
jgi:hypothetical protein